MFKGVFVMCYIERVGGEKDISFHDNNRHIVIFKRICRTNPIFLLLVDDLKFLDVTFIWGISDEMLLMMRRMAYRVSRKTFLIRWMYLKLYETVKISYILFVLSINKLTFQHYLVCFLSILLSRSVPYSECLLGVRFRCFISKPLLFVLNAGLSTRPLPLIFHAILN